VGAPWLLYHSSTLSVLPQVNAQPTPIRVLIVAIQGYFTCYGTVNYSDSISWRLPLGLQAVVAIVLAVGTPFFPHSPDWLLSVGRRSEAEAAARTLGLQPTEIHKEDEGFGSGPAPEASRQTLKQQATELWAKDVRFRTLFGLFLMGMGQVCRVIFGWFSFLTTEQACGIDAVLYVRGPYHCVSWPDFF
jgi:hypothetical protein